MTPNQDCHCPRVQHYHGTRNNYLTHACRCTPCTTDATRERDKIRRLKAYGRPRTQKIDATQARKHAQKLIQNGMTITQIARAANLSHPAIGRLIGTGNYKPSKNILNTTATAVLNIRPHTPTTGHTNATGTKRRIQALVAIGYPYETQGRLAGITPEKPRHILGQTHTDTQTAQAITTLFTQLQLKPAPPSRHRLPRSTRSRIRSSPRQPPMPSLLHPY